MGKRKSFAEGMRAYRRGDYPAALRSLDPLTAQPDLAGRLARHYAAMSHRAMGLECMAGGRFSQAAGHFRRAVALVGNRADLVEHLLAAYAGTGQYDRCASAADVLSAARPEETHPRVQLAHAQWRSGKRPLAFMTLTEALRRLGDHADLHRNLGLLYAAEEKLDLARRHLRRAAECDCTCPRTQHALGLVESARGDFPAAARALQRAWALSPKDLVIAYQLSLAADAAARSGQPVAVALPEAEAPAAPSQVRRLAEYAVREPRFIDAFLALPVSEADEELFGVLLSVLRTAIGEHEDYADLRYYAGVALQRLGQAEEAGRELRHAIRINPEYVNALLKLAEVTASAGDAKVAVGYLQRAIRAGAEYPDVHVRLGDLLRRCGRTAPAREHYRRALKLNGRYRAAADRLAALAA